MFINKPSNQADIPRHNLQKPYTRTLGLPVNHLTPCDNNLIINNNARFQPNRIINIQYGDNFFRSHIKPPAYRRKVTL